MPLINNQKEGGDMFRNSILMALIAAVTSGCCAISCNTRLPNSHLKVSSVTPADCTYADKAGVRQFKASGSVLGMPKNAPGKLTCLAKGYRPFIRTVTAEDWSPLAPLSGGTDAVRYYVEIEMVMEAEQ